MGIATGSQASRLSPSFVSHFRLLSAASRGPLDKLLDLRWVLSSQLQIDAVHFSVSVSLCSRAQFLKSAGGVNVLLWFRSPENAIAEHFMRLSSVRPLACDQCFFMICLPRCAGILFYRVLNAH